MLIDIIDKVRFVELEDVFKISHVKACLNCHGKFFIFANKREKIKGIFLLQLDEDDLELGLDIQENLAENDRYLIKWSAMLDVSDVNIFCIEESARDSFLVQEMKEKFRKRFNEKYLKKA